MLSGRTEHLQLAPLASDDSAADDDALTCLEELTSGLLKRVVANRRRLEKQVYQMLLFAYLLES